MKRGNYIVSAVRGLAASFLVSVLLLLGLAFLLLKFQWDAGQTELAILAIYVISCLAGGWFCGRKTEKKKFLSGAGIGILYFFLLLAVSAMSTTGIQSGLTSGILACILCTIGGMVGGMLS